jgi:hypothetical protein
MKRVIIFLIINFLPIAILWIVPYYFLDICYTQLIDTKYLSTGLAIIVTTNIQFFYFILNNKNGILRIIGNKRPLPFNNTIKIDDIRLLSAFEDCELIDCYCKTKFKSSDSKFILPLSFIPNRNSLIINKDKELPFPISFELYSKDLDLKNFKIRFKFRTLNSNMDRTVRLKIKM